MEPPLATIILAAGLGTRMRSQRAKVLHELGGEPMLAHTLRAVAAVHPWPLIIVVGHQAAIVEAAARRILPNYAIHAAYQRRQLGTGDAAHAGVRIFPADFSGDVLIGYGDMPMLNPATLRDFIESHRSNGGSLSFISVKLTDGGSYGRVIRDAHGAVEAIVEARDAMPRQLSISEINTGIYLAKADFLRSALAKIQSNNTQNEYYLTDIVAIARRLGVEVNAWIAPEAAEFAGVNSCEELAQMEAQLREQVNRQLMKAGVTLIDPATAYIGPEVEIGSETNVGCGVITVNYDGYDKHVTRIGDRCMVGCDTQLVAPVTVGDDVYVASGTTILRDVPDGALVMSDHPQREKPGWTETWHQRHANHPKTHRKTDKGSG